MAEGSKTAAEALRILRQIESAFPDNTSLTGSGFVGTQAGTVITCAHVVTNPAPAKSIKVSGKPASLLLLDTNVDLAVLSTNDTETSTFGKSVSIEIGNQLMFSGYPTGVASASVFGGILSSAGENLLKAPRCRLLQINGMINSGNSGGPVFELGGTKVVGVITAKHVPLLQEIDKLREILRSIPQLPSEVGIGKVDFSKFVNLMLQALLTVSGSLRLVQVGTGYAVPIEFLPKK